MRMAVIPDTGLLETDSPCQLRSPEVNVCCTGVVIPVTPLVEAVVGFCDPVSTAAFEPDTTSGTDVAVVEVAGFGPNASSSRRLATVEEPPVVFTDVFICDETPGVVCGSSNADSGFCEVETGCEGTAGCATTGWACCVGMLNARRSVSETPENGVSPDPTPAGAPVLQPWTLTGST